MTAAMTFSLLLVCEDGARTVRLISDHASCAEAIQSMRLGGITVLLVAGCLFRTTDALKLSRDIDSPFTFCRGGATEDADGFRLVSDEVIYDGWRRLIRRRVVLPSSLVTDFEIVAQRGTDQAVLVFVWDSHTKTATMIREYMPALHQRLLGLAAGMVERKHDNASPSERDHLDTRRTAVEHELEEECRLRGGTWHQVTAANSTMDKYSSTKLAVYLVIDPESVPASEAKPRDVTEEGMEVISGLTIHEIMDHITRGKLTVVGGWACMLAIHKLKELGEIQE